MKAKDKIKERVSKLTRKQSKDQAAVVASITGGPSEFYVEIDGADWTVWDGTLFVAEPTVHGLRMVPVGNLNAYYPVRF